MRVFAAGMGAFLLALAAALACPAPAAAQSRDLYEGDSIYHHITVRQDDSERCMIFGRQRDLRQTCMDLKQPDRSLFEYTSMMFGAFLFKPEARRICLIGLGGGFIPLVFKLHLPQVRLQIVEVDPLVERLAREHFQFTVPQGQALTIDDGRQFLKKSGERFDQIWLDAFNSDYIPSHMTTKEFLEVVKARLTQGGIVVQNLFSGNRLYDSQIATMQSVFAKVFVFGGAHSGSAIIVATDDPKADLKALAGAAAKLKGRIGRIDLAAEAKKCVVAPKDDKAQILTDDFNPANLLLMKKP